MTLLSKSLCEDFTTLPYWTTTVLGDSDVPFITNDAQGVAQGVAQGIPGSLMDGQAVPRSPDKIM